MSMKRRKVGQGSFASVYALPPDRKKCAKYFFDEIGGLTSLRELAILVGVKKDPLFAQLESVIRVSESNRKKDHVESLAFLFPKYPGNMSRKYTNFSKILGIMYDVGLGLEKMHNISLIHADVKPDNILVDENGRGVLIDFGYSTPEKMFDCKAEWKVMNSVAIPPEFYDSNDPPNKAMDIWCFGNLLYYHISQGDFMNHENLSVLESVVNGFKEAPKKELMQFLSKTLVDVDKRAKSIREILDLPLFAKVAKKREDGDVNIRVPWGFDRPTYKQVERDILDNVEGIEPYYASIIAKKYCSIFGWVDMLPKHIASLRNLEEQEWKFAEFLLRDSGITIKNEQENC